MHCFIPKFHMFSRIFFFGFVCNSFGAYSTGHQTRGPRALKLLCCDIWLAINCCNRAPIATLYLQISYFHLLLCNIGRSPWGAHHIWKRAIFMGRFIYWVLLVLGIVLYGLVYVFSYVTIKEKYSSVIWWYQVIHVQRK